MRRTTAILALLAGPALAQDPELLVFDYSGFEDPAFHPGYVEKHGTGPSFSFFGDEDEALQKVRSGFRADIAHICGDSVSKWREAGVLDPWDTSRIEAFGDLNTDLTGEDLTQGESYFLPTDYGSTAIAYNAAEVPAEAVSTLEVFLDPAYAGRITLPVNVADTYALAFLATGVTDWAGIGDAELEAASNWLREVHPNVRTYWTDPGELAQLLASGEVLISWAWNETLPTMAEEGFDIGFEREAAEGSSLWLCGYVNLSAGEGSEDRAYDYMNAILAPDATQPLLDAGYGHANAASMEAFGDEALTEVGLGEIDAPILAQLPQDPAFRQKMNEQFELIKAGF